MSSCLDTGRINKTFAKALNLIFPGKIKNFDFKKFDIFRERLSLWKDRGWVYRRFKILNLCFAEEKKNRKKKQKN